MPDPSPTLDHHGGVVLEPADDRPPPPPPRLANLSPVAVDLLLVAVITVVPLLFVAIRPGQGHPKFQGELLVGAAIAIPLLVLRRRWPLPLLGVALLGSVVLMAFTEERTPLLAAVVVLLLTVATVHERRTAVIAGLVTVAVLYAAALAFLDTGWISPEVFAIVAWSALAVAAGDAVRSRRAYLAEVADRAQRAEVTRREAARRQVVEERLRIARDLHDLVAHRMAVIGVQSAAAKVLLRTDPDRAEESLEAVRLSASTVLDELGGLLQVLREPGDGTAPGPGPDATTAPTLPTPDLGDLDQLIASFAAAGLQVDTRTTGDAAGVPESVQLAAYRIVQEALTNAQRHGDGRARLEFARSPATIDLVVENGIPAGAPDTAGSGFGLIGMHERVATCGGTIEAGPVAADRFRITVRLPFTPEPTR